MTQNYPAYQVTCADIDRLKVVAARVFDRKVSPQSRLEIIARSAGFNSFAALKAALADGPVWLLGDQYREELHIKSAGIDPKLVPFINGISLNEIIAAGLAWSERDDPEWAANKPPRQKLKALKRDGASMKDYLQFLYGEFRSAPSNLHVYRSSLTWADLRNLEEDAKSRARCAQSAVIMTTPDNTISASIDPETNEPRAIRPGAWRCARVPLSPEVRFFDTPVAEPVPWEDPDALRELIEDARIMVFDEKDLAAVKSSLSNAGFASLPDYRFVVVKPDALNVEMETEGDFFSVGYLGTARNDAAPIETCRDEGWLSQFTFAWFCEIVNIVHGCEYELRHLTGGNADYVDDLSYEGHHRLIVPV